MQIAMIGHKSFPSRSGGVEVVVQELATRLTLAGDKVTVYNRGGKSKDKHLYIDNVEVYNTFSIKKDGIGAVISSFIATIHLPFRQYDIVHYHAIGPSLMIPLAKLFRKRTVATVHGLDWQRSKWGRFARAYLKFGEKMMVRFADSIITITESDQEYFLKNYNRETYLIKNAITPVEISEAKQIKEKFGLSKYSYILYLGRIDQVKGITYLIDAYNRIETDKKLVIAGALDINNEYVQRVIQMAKENPNILLVGQAEGELLSELYSNTCLYVLPSEMEGLPLSLLEAMSTGSRCLASNIPGNICALGGYGTTFVSENVDSLTEALKNLLAQDDENPRAEEQIQYIKSEYNYERVVCQTREIYVKTAEKRKSI